MKMQTEPQLLQSKIEETLRHVASINEIVSTMTAEQRADALKLVEITLTKRTS